MNNEIKSDFVEFILGGKSEFTILQDPDKEYKYKVEKGSWGDGSYFVSTCGSKGRLTYMGILRMNKSTGRYIFTKGRNITNFNDTAINGLLWVLDNAVKLPHRAVHIIHHGRCGVCGRPLSDSVSLECGVGPTCKKKIGGF